MSREKAAEQTQLAIRQDMADGKIDSCRIGDFYLRSNPTGLVEHRLDFTPESVAADFDVAVLTGAKVTIQIIPSKERLYVEQVVEAGGKTWVNAYFQSEWPYKLQNMSRGEIRQHAILDELRSTSETVFDDGMRFYHRRLELTSEQEEAGRSALKNLPTYFWYYIGPMGSGMDILPLHNHGHARVAYGRSHKVQQVSLGETNNERVVRACLRK